MNPRLAFGLSILMSLLGSIVISVYSHGRGFAPTCGRPVVLVL